MERYLPRLPVDPWGTAYLTDANFGVIATLGGDGKPGGEFDDQDLLVHYRGALKPMRVHAAEGLVAKGGVVKVVFTKPVELKGDLAAELVVLGPAGSVALDAGGAHFTASMEEGTWSSALSTVILTCDRPAVPPEAGAKFVKDAQVGVKPAGKDGWMAAVTERLAPDSFLERMDRAKLRSSPPEYYPIHVERPR